MEHSFTIEPGPFVAFENEEQQMDKCKEWGLLSEKATKTKAFFYKGHGLNLSCDIVGYVDKVTAVIEFDNKERHCIHPSYLKEMQAANYGQKQTVVAEAEETVSETDSADKTESSQKASATTTEKPAEPRTAEPKADEPKAEAKPKAKEQKGKAQKLQLPEDKVKMTATVKQFTTVPNHFSDTEDEVVIYEAVSIEEPEIEVGDAWSSYSATLKKLGLEIGDTLTFEGKIAAKKLTKHPVPYKINNPSKIAKG